MSHHNLIAQMMGEEVAVAPVSDGSAFNIHCTNADAGAGWILTSLGNSLASVVSNTFFNKFSGATFDANNIAQFSLNPAFIPLPNRIVASFLMEVDHLENFAETTVAVQYIVQTVASSKRLLFAIYNDGVAIRDTAGIDQFFAVGPPPYGSQFTMTTDVDVNNQLSNIWYEDSKKVSAADCGNTGPLAGHLRMAVINRKAAGYTPITVKTDQIKIGGAV